MTGDESASVEARAFLGTGFGFPPTTDGRGAVRSSSGERTVEESMRVVLGTAKGERVMRPDFGCGIHDHVFEEVVPATVTLAETSVSDALTRFEPRIEVLAVDATPAGEAGESRLDVRVEYRIRSTNAEGNFVYPFYLRGE